MRDPDWQTEDGSIQLHCGDCREVVGAVTCDTVITDPVWPNCPVGLLIGASNPFDLLSSSIKDYEARTVVICLGFNSDPRFLTAVPSRWPFIRSQQLPYAVPSYMGRLLGGDEMAYVFGGIPPGNGVIPGRMSTVTSYKADRATGHPCPRADQHMLDLVKWWSCPGELVCDPFMGTGAVAVACTRLGRKFIGCEIDRRYYDIATKRVEAELHRMPLLESPPKILTKQLPGFGEAVEQLEGEERG